ncbi:MAG: hypothetical protein DI533_14215 [Cereibacter sphaeroides]|uniref:NnrU domain-containing protein n=1 Tax=Cereibacter sphaeroides TaxID=1063 RepID=A0A2W5S4R5_CERSP|nr:MAG: hypothetical protein DI533_14215 [Cereibacter sphaeroides]
MVWLILGVALWWGAHFFRRIAPAARASLGDRGKGLVALLLVLSVVFMVLGYRSADFIYVYSPPPGARHLNNLLMLFAVFLFGVGGTKGLLYPRMRHPMLWGTVIWSVAHLMVNGDLASLILFGGIGAWAIVTMIVINRSDIWVPPVNGRGIRGDVMNLFGTVALYAVIAGVHIWLGYNPFMGT